MARQDSRTLFMCISMAANVASTTAINTLYRGSGDPSTCWNSSSRRVNSCPYSAIERRCCRSAIVGVITGKSGDW
ncbi:hypothetical protein PR002_g29065 [Phytophthora rubi]|uniref:Uncharacterized protein n=1 Tax=Phytophthora rubi TaxID=129364 RepID=A0A6A3H5T2_9STRA|nr:hypothetical protein PR002_g29065 [Phytophthora rubi]